MCKEWFVMHIIRTVQLYLAQSSQKREAENFFLMTTVMPWIIHWPTPTMFPVDKGRSGVKVRDYEPQHENIQTHNLKQQHATPATTNSTYLSVFLSEKGRKTMKIKKNNYDDHSCFYYRFQQLNSMRKQEQK